MRGRSRPCRPPPRGHEKNWIPAVPGKAWFAYLSKCAGDAARHFLKRLHRQSIINVIRKRPKGPSDIVLACRRIT